MSTFGILSEEDNLVSKILLVTNSTVPRFCGLIFNFGKFGLWNDGGEKFWGSSSFSMVIDFGLPIVKDSIQQYYVLHC